MGKYTELIRESIIRDMSEGVMTIGFDGMITYLNPVAEQILDRKAEQLVGTSFVGSFFEYSENDDFNQVILDAAYDHDRTHRAVVAYYTGSETRQLHVTTSFLHEGEERIGIIVVLSDISELMELRDAVKSMERIKKLNDQLELRNKLLNETFGRFLSDEIVRQLLDTPDGLALGGKKRRLTVMMSDLRGFTAMSERMPAQDLLSMLNHYLGEMTEVIQRRSGTIIEFIGDGILAIFGAPVQSEFHASDAVAAAVEMQARMAAINDWNSKRSYPKLEMGIGINTGEVIVGNIGSEKRTKYGVVGSHVNLCGRIESYTTGGQILISPETRAMIHEPLDIAGEHEIFPKGAQLPLTISQVTGIGGKYGVSCSTQEEIPEKLNTPIDVKYVTIHEKHVEAVSQPGKLTALGRSCAILETDSVPEEYTNVQIELAPGVKIYAKVIKLDGQSALLRFTSVPPEFDAWYNKKISGK